jgi:hypothetical protein
MPENQRFPALFEKLEALNIQPDRINTKKVVAGFDGFIDSIAKPVKQSGGKGDPLYFGTIAEFGSYITGQAHKSGSIELDIMGRRMGGNMPNFSGAAAALGLSLTCIGMLSSHRDITGNSFYPSDSPELIDPVFKSLPGKLYSFAVAGTAEALEFEDGKIFFAPRCHLEKLPPSAFLAECLAGAELVACLNWGELAFATPLWRNMLNASIQYRETKPSDGTRIQFFFDLSDFSHRGDEEIEEVFSLIDDFSTVGTVILSLNRNEAQLLSERLFRGTLERLPDAVQQRYKITEVIIHSHDGARVSRDGKIREITTSPVASPKLSTGAGDNFNAAYAFATLMELPVEDKLQFAVLYARTYVQEGKSFSLEEFLRHLSPLPGHLAD